MWKRKKNRVRLFQLVLNEMDANANYRMKKVRLSKSGFYIIGHYA